MTGGQVSAGEKVPHLASNVFISPDKYNFTGPIVDSSAAIQGLNKLVKAHGILMILAWMIFASFGVLLPKYYKATWPRSKWCGKAIWFQLHQPVMIIVLFLTTAAFIIIFVRVRKYSQLPAPTNAHPPIGIIVMILTLINPLMAAVRCEPTARRRPIFNVLHSIVGYLVHFASVVAILLGLYMKHIGLPDWCRWVFIAFICWHIFIEIVLLIHQQCLVVRHNGGVTGTHDGMDIEPSRKRDAAPTDSVFKTIILITHLIVITGLAIAICVQIGRT